MSAGGPEEIRPIFVLSLPRTGSTLLQRILGSHEAIGTASEPGFLLPLLYATRERGVLADYAHAVNARGVLGFAEEYLPNGRGDYEDAVRDLALRVYRLAAPGKPYFLDKTPRYHHVADDLLRLFPESKPIFLWRHPLAVAASMIETFDGGRWNLDRYASDLVGGLARLVSAREAARDRSVSVRYEDLVARPAEEVARLLDYLGLPHDDSLVTRFAELEMRNREYWDPTGPDRYRSVSTGSLDRWRATMASPLRRAWCRRYVRWIGRERLAAMGYSLDRILDEVDALPRSLRRLPSDAARASKGAARRRVLARALGVPLPLWRLGGR